MEPRTPASEISERLRRPDSELREVLEEAIDGRADRLVRLRRRLHATPEASNEERETTALVVEALREHGYEPRTMADGVGVVADLDLEASTETFIAMRAELDCVGVNDDKQVPYASTQPGHCHACGHDAHTSMLLASAAAMADHRSRLIAHGFRHNVRFIFQPAEETATGARSMIKQGALNGVEGIIALHVDPYLEVGSVGVRVGPVTSACKLFHIQIRGRSGHTARPFEAIDPIPAATNIVSLLYQLCPRSVDNRYPLAITVASIQAGAAFNAIPDRAMIAGTLRAARLVDLEAVQKRMEAIVAGAKEATGCDVELEFRHATPATDNDRQIINIMAGAAAEVIGDQQVEWIEVASLGGEDFAYYQELVPGAIVRLGTAFEDGRMRRPLHSSLFDIDERSLAIGAKVIAWSALRLASSFGGEHA